MSFLTVSPGNREPRSEVNHLNFAIHMETKQKSFFTLAPGNLLANFLELKVRLSACWNHKHEIL
jgi:hypothetical protein